MSTEEQHRFCPLHSSYHYTNSTPILPQPPLMPGTRDSYSLAQIPVCTTLWHEPVHTISRFSAHLFVPSSGTNWCILPHGQHLVHEPSTSPYQSWCYLEIPPVLPESPSHSYFSFLPSSLSTVSESLTLLPSTLMTFHLTC